MSGRKPLPAAIMPAIARLRQIAAESDDHLLLGDGPPHQDAKLLDLCAEALHHLTMAEEAYRSRPGWIAPWTDATRAENERLLGIFNDGINRAKSPLKQISKMKATTGAGIYAKALVVRASRTGARMLAMTLAEDLVNNPALRAMLWAADPGPVAEAGGNVVALPVRARRAGP